LKANCRTALKTEALTRQRASTSIALQKLDVTKKKFLVGCFYDRKNVKIASETLFQSGKSRNELLFQYISVVSSGLLNYFSFVVFFVVTIIYGITSQPTSIRRGFYALATFLTYIKRDSIYRDIACTHLHITYTARIITYDRP